MTQRVEVGAIVPPVNRDAEGRVATNGGVLHGPLTLEQSLADAVSTDIASYRAEIDIEAQRFEPSDWEVLQVGFTSWARNKASQIRAAGHRATWEGRRDVRGRTFADRERGFVGKYAGKCAIPQSMVAFGENEVVIGRDIHVTETQ